MMLKVRETRQWRQPSKTYWTYIGEYEKLQLVPKRMKGGKENGQLANLVKTLRVLCL